MIGVTVVVELRLIISVSDGIAVLQGKKLMGFGERKKTIDEETQVRNLSKVCSRATQ